MKILQIGDIHLKETAGIAKPIDSKDVRFPANLEGMLAEPHVKTAFRRIHRLIEDKDVDALLFMGDLADKGEIDSYESCAKYIAESLQIGESRKFGELPVGIIPGNHDIDRDLALKPGMAAKFSALQKIHTKLRLPRLPVEKPIWMQVNKHDCKLSIAQMNSCWGCGSSENIPEQFRSGITKAISDALDNGAEKKAVQAYYDRQLDTPAFDASAIQQLAADAQDISRDHLIVCCAHHNLLPQRTVRLAPYTELVNSGMFRNSLFQMERPVLYLHGHIHEDPIEIIQTPTGGCVCSISAPLITDGFNELEIVFTANKLPLACYVRPWRFDQNGILSRQPHQTIALSSNRRKLGSPILHAIYLDVIENGKRYWAQLQQQIEELTTIENMDTSTEAIEEALESLAADGLINIENYDIGKEHWIVSLAI